MDVTLEGITTPVKPLQFTNAKFPMDVTGCPAAPNVAGMASIPVGAAPVSLCETARAALPLAITASPPTTE